MTAFPADELDRLVQENKVLGTMDGDARRQLRDALEPVAVPAGTVLVREGDAAGCLFLVAAGRLRVVTPHGTREGGPLAEIGRGGLVGEMALLPHRPRTATVRVLRDAHLLKLSTTAFTQLVASHPESARRISTEMVDRLLRSRLVGRPSTPVVSICLLPLDGEPALRTFGEQLERALSRLTGSAQQIDVHAAKAAVGDDLDPGRFAQWSSDLETDHEVVVYRADPEPTPWTRACVRQADLLLLVGDATTAPTLRQVERVALQGRDTEHIRTELV